MVLLKLLFITSLICLFEYYSEAKISDQRLCANLECDQLISKGITTQKYAGNDPHLLCFEEGADVEVYSKGAGSRDDLWGVKIKGKHGFVSKQFIKETQVYIRNPNFTLPLKPSQDSEVEGPPKVSHEVSSEELQTSQITEKDEEKLLESSLSEETLSSPPIMPHSDEPQASQSKEDDEEKLLESSLPEETMSSPPTSTHSPKSSSKKRFTVIDQTTIPAEEFEEESTIPSSENLSFQTSVQDEPSKKTSILPSSNIETSRDEQVHLPKESLLSNDLYSQTSEEESSEYSSTSTSILETNHPHAIASIAVHELSPSHSNQVLESSRESLEISSTFTSTLLETKQPHAVASRADHKSSPSHPNQPLEPSTSSFLNADESEESSSYQSTEDTLYAPNKLSYKVEKNILKSKKENLEINPIDSQSFQVRSTLSVLEKEKKNPIEGEIFDTKENPEKKDDLTPIIHSNELDAAEHENESIFGSEEIIESEKVHLGVTESMADIADIIPPQSIKKENTDFLLVSSLATPPIPSNSLQIETESKSHDSASNLPSLPEETSSSLTTQTDEFLHSEAPSLDLALEPSLSSVTLHADSITSSESSQIINETSSNFSVPSDNTLRPEIRDESRNNIDTNDASNIDYTISTKGVDGLQEDNTSVPLFIYFFGRFEALLDLLPESVSLMLLDTRVSPHLIVFSVAFTVFSIAVSLIFVFFDRRGEVQRLNRLLCATEQKYFAMHVERNNYKEEVEAYKAKVSSLSTNFQNIKQPLTKEVAAYKAQVAELQNALSSLSSLKVNLETLQHQNNELQTLNQKLEAELDDVTTKLKDAEADYQIVTQARLELETLYEEQQLELATLQNQDESLKAEVKLLEQRIGELTLENEDCKSLITNLKGSLEQKEAEVKSMKDLIELVKENPAAGQGDQGELEEKLKKLLDVSLLKEKVTSLETERESLVSKMYENGETIKKLEEEVARLQGELTQAQQDYNQALQDRTDARTKLDVLTAYFKEKEVQLQKELGLQQSMRQQKESDASYAMRNIELLEEENASYKSQLASLKQELETSQRKHKAELAEEQKKLHDSWISLRNTQRKLEDAQKEAASLRQRLTTMEKEHALKLKNALEECKKSPINDASKNVSNTSTMTPRSDDSMDAAHTATKSHPATSGPSPNLLPVIDPPQFNPHFNPHQPMPPFFDERMPPPPFFGEHMPPPPPPRFPGGPGSPADMWRFPAPIPPPFPQPSYSYEPPPIKPHFDERRSQRWKDRPRDHKEDLHYYSPQGERQVSTPTRHPKHPEGNLHRSTPPSNSPVPQDNRRDTSVNMDGQPHPLPEGKSQAFEPYPPKERGFSQASTSSLPRQHPLPAKVPPPPLHNDSGDPRAASFNFSGPKLQKTHPKAHAEKEPYSSPQKSASRPSPPKEDSMV